ncbi:MAG: hypothetical protein ACXVYB_00235 [Arthrobacter sp.]
MSERTDVTDEEYEATRLTYYPMDPPQGTPLKNARGNYCVEEVVHHGDYRHVRIVEVHELNERTVGAIVRSGPYVYSAADDSPQVARILADLKTGRVNRSHGWSTFRVLHLEEQA